MSTYKIACLCADKQTEIKLLGELVKIKHGRDWKKLGKGKIPVYGSGGIMGHVDRCSYDKPTVLIPRKGTITNIFYLEEPFWNVDTIYYTEIDTKQIIPKFFYYYMKSLDLTKLDTGSGRPSLTLSVLEKIKIPIPPLEVQKEIVRILDKFTQLETESSCSLRAELEARRKQYQHYRDALLTFKDKTAREMTLGDLGKISMCKRIFKHETTTKGRIPFYKIGTFGALADAFISQELYEDYRRKFSFPKKGDVLISASGTIGRTLVYDGNAAYFQDSNIVWIDNDESQVLNSFLYYLYQVINWETDGATIQRLYNENIRRTKIVVPSIEVQKRIVSILDKFDTLVNDLSEGLPAEIKARRQQYEHYRDQLLSFKEIV